MNNIKMAIGVGLLLIGLGAAVGRYSVPECDKQETTKDTTEEIKDIEETTTETKKPDGTIVKETKKIDKTITKDTHKKETITEDKKSNYRAAALVGYNFNTFLPVYGAAIEKRIIGNLSVGVWGTTDRSVGASLSLEF